MPLNEAPCVELGSAPGTPNVIASPSVSEVSSASSPEPHQLRVTPLFRALTLPPPEPDQPPGQEELERRLPGYRRIVIPRELTLIELLRQSSGVNSDEDVLRLREVKLQVVAERVGLRRLHVLTPRLHSLTLDGSAISSLRDLGIGLRRLKILSVNRCGLTCLDGIWGLGCLRELYAARNHLKELHPLAALQKLHTLDLSHNPVSQVSRLWTLGVCSSLRRLTMCGTPAAEDSNYRTQIASALPLLVYLDDRPLHNDIAYDSFEEISNAMSSSSDSEDDLKVQTEEPGPSGSLPSNVGRKLQPENSMTKNVQDVPESNVLAVGGRNDGDVLVTNARTHQRSQRPATTEGVAARPRINLPPRPRTAHDHRSEYVTQRFQILNTLLDDEWRCNGSDLTSRGAVCGNLARALRRPSSTRCNIESVPSTSYQRPSCSNAYIQSENYGFDFATAKEIPRDSSIEEWAKFREITGIEVELNFNERPKDIDPDIVIKKLEQIEMETRERLQRESEKEYELTKEIALEWERKNKFHPLMQEEDDDLDNTITNIYTLDSEIWSNVADLNNEEVGLSYDADLSSEMRIDLEDGHDELNTSIDSILM